MAGQEGAQIGSAHALEEEDQYVPSYRKHAGMMVLGLDPRDILLYWKGNEVGNAIPEELNIFPVSITDWDSRAARDKAGLGIKAQGRASSIP